MRDITEPTDLCVPIYLNQKIVFDVLAMLEDGFSQLSVLKTSASEAENRKSGVGGSDSGESINLLRKTDFGRLNSAMFDELSNVFAGVEEAGVDLPEVVAEVKGPAIQIIPVAIFA